LIRDSGRTELARVLFSMYEDGARHGGHPRLGPHGVGPDLISALPEDLFFQVLRPLGCARAAVRTSLVSRHWRGLWRCIPDLTFRDVTLCLLLPAIRSIVCIPRVLLLDICITDVDPIIIRQPHDQCFDADRVSSLLRAAADVLPVELRFSVTPAPSYSLNVPLPCFLHATFVELHGLDLLFSELPDRSRYMFPTLETLHLSKCSIYDSDALILHCPRLRVFKVTHCFRYSFSVLELHLTPTRLDYNKRSVARHRHRTSTRKVKIVLLRSEVISFALSAYIARI
jgi:hypothetical protein